MGDLMTPVEAANALGVSTGTVRRLRQEGALRTVRLGYRTVRLHRSDVHRLIARWTTNEGKGHAHSRHLS
jgi:excisionase family DNA binding protein